MKHFLISIFLFWLNCFYYFDGLQTLHKKSQGSYFQHHNNQDANKNILTFLGTSELECQFWFVNDKIFKYSTNRK